MLESYEEHHVADMLCFELSTMDADDERFNAKATVLIESVTHHIGEEEQDWFPKVREALGRKQLQDLGARMEALRPKASLTRQAPHLPVRHHVRPAYRRTGRGQAGFMSGS